MKYRSELELKEQLGIDSWRNLSKDKMMEFAQLMSTTDPGILRAIIEQFPSFTEFANNVIDSLDQGYQVAIASNERSMDAFHEACREVREILKGELNRELSQEERLRLLDCLLRLVEMQSQKDTEIKRFLEGLFEKKGSMLASVALSALVVLASAALSQGRSHGGPAQLPKAQ